MITAQPQDPLPASLPLPVKTRADETVAPWRSAVVGGLAVLAILSAWLNPHAILQPQAGVEMRLPGEVNGFIGHDSPISAAELTILPKDTEFVRRTYDDFKGDNIMCSIVLSGAEERSIHRPEVCLVAQGWTIAGQRNVPISLASGRELTVRNLYLQRQVVSSDNVRHSILAYYMYWFVGDGMTTPSHFTRMFLSSWDRIFRGRAHRWAYVIAMSNITNSYMPNGLDAPATETMLTRFIRDAVPTFQKSEIPADGS